MTVFSVLQATTGAAFALYAYKNSSNQTLFIVSSVVAVGGICNAINNIRKIYRKSADFEKKIILSAGGLATATAVYSTSIFAFSRAFERGDFLWRPCVALATFGYLGIAVSLENMELFFSRKIYLKCCQLLYGPALILSTAFYLVGIRNHNEECLYWLPFVIIGGTGFETASRGSSRVATWITKSMLLKFVETMTGGCLLTGSSVILTIYFLVNGYHYLWAVAMAILGLFGAFFIGLSLTSLRRYTQMDAKVFMALSGMVAGPIFFVFACLFITFVNDATMAYLSFLFFGGFSHYLFYISTCKLFRSVPIRKFERYFRRVARPIMATYTSMATIYIGYYMGWRYCLPVVPFPLLGTYGTYCAYVKDI